MNIQIFSKFYFKIWFEKNEIGPAWIILDRTKPHFFPTIVEKLRENEMSYADEYNYLILKNNINYW